ncbi:type VI immunity family protein [Dyadobacter jiangsuensis]|uniref:Uncharacterized protein DUF3396 n=1 Tax=Dyadobacter jiangsuensis TaxID=1591085 RepID=A0A2P8FQE9_9BACT|nr:type VI immunity family protein [Dyadobacter jiangsuensis]PSL23952.1 uncharacterized protein DUF3396 [Dyadobacter jiangsuensis]
MVIGDDVLICKEIVDSLLPKNGDETLLCLSFYVTLYFEDGHLSAKRRACVDLFDEYRRIFDAPLMWGTHPKKYTWKPFEPSLSPSSWLIDTHQDVWQYYYHGGKTYDSCSPWRVQAFGYPSMAPGHKLSFLNVALPITFFIDQPAFDVPKLFTNWCDILQPLHGSGGFAVLASPDAKKEMSISQQIRVLAQRFPGLEVDYPASHILYLQNTIKGVNWLTCLGDRWIEQLGGVDWMRKDLGNEFIFHSYTKGLLIQAGPQPGVGDNLCGAGIAHYKKLFSVLRHICCYEHAPLLGFDQKSTTQWFRRFDWFPPIKYTS